MPPLSEHVRPSAVLRALGVVALLLGATCCGSRMTHPSYAERRATIEAELAAMRAGTTPAATSTESTGGGDAFDEDA